MRSIIFLKVYSTVHVLTEGGWCLISADQPLLHDETKVTPDNLLNQFCRSSIQSEFVTARQL